MAYTGRPPAAAPLTSGDIPDGSITTADLVDDAVTPAKLSTGAPEWTSGYDVSFYEDTGTTAKFFWDASAESLGIGTSSPTGTLTVYKDIDSVTVPTSKSDYSIVVDVNGNVSDSYIGGIAFGDNAVSTAQAAILAVDAGGSAATHLAFATGSTAGITERMRIDSSGRVTMPYQPAFSVGGDSNYFDPNTPYIDFFGSSGEVLLNNGSHFNTANGRFTAPVAGNYLFILSTTTDDTNSHFIDLAKNGTRLLRHMLSYSQGQLSASNALVVPMSANDYVTAQRRSSGYNFYSVHFCGYLIG